MYNVIQENAENTVDHDAGKINGRFSIVPSEKENWTQPANGSSLLLLILCCNPQLHFH
jgi:hypothetical protein